MVNSDNSQELDFDSMTEEELETYIKGNGQVNEPEENDDNADLDSRQPDTETNISDNSDKTETEQNNDDNPDSDDILKDPNYARYANKGKKELIDMVLNGTKKISEQGNVIHEFRTRLEAIERVGNKTDGTDKDIEGYDKNDIETIRKLAKREALDVIKQTEQEQINIREQQRVQEIARAREDNDKVWLFAKSLFPDVAKNIEGELISELQSDPDSTINVSGWAERRIRELMKDKIAPNQSQVVKKKTVVKPFNSGVSSGSVKPPVTFNLNVEPDDPEEYLEWYKQKTGIDLRKK